MSGTAPKALFRVGDRVLVDLFAGTGDPSFHGWEPVEDIVLEVDPSTPEYPLHVAGEGSTRGDWVKHTACTPLPRP